MKKSLLALAVLAVATSATAATVYDKDGTSLKVGGRVQAIAYNGNFAKAGRDDSTLKNSARFNIAGNTKVNDAVSVFAFSEWEASNGDDTDNFVTRDQYVGADFGVFGKVQAGKSLNSIYDVQSATDVFEETGALMQGETNGDRRSGTFRYIYDNNGLYAAASFQIAQDQIKVEGEKVDVENGFGLGLGYSFDNVVFGPLSIKAAYDYVKCQDDKDFTQINAPKVDYDPVTKTLEWTSGRSFDSFKNTAVSVAWGSDTGLYLAGLFNVIKATYDDSFEFFFEDSEWVREHVANSRDIVKGFELVAGYGFDNGLSFTIGYDVKDAKEKATGYSSESSILRRVPVIANYQIAPTFKVWAEAEFDAGSSQNAKEVFEDRNCKETKLAAGARYVF